MIEGGENGFGEPVVLVEACVAAPMVPLSLFFHDVRGLTAMAAGLMFLPMTTVVAVANLVSARFGSADRAGMAAGVLNSFRPMGGALAAAVFGAVAGLRVALCVALLLPRRFTAG